MDKMADSDKPWGQKEGRWTIFFREARMQPGVQIWTNEKYKKAYVIKKASEIRNSHKPGKSVNGTKPGEQWVCGWGYVDGDAADDYRIWVRLLSGEHSGF